MVIVVGGEILKPGKDIVTTCKKLVEQVTRLAKKG